MIYRSIFTILPDFNLENYICTLSGILHDLKDIDYETQLQQKQSDDKEAVRLVAKYNSSRQNFIKKWQCSSNFPQSYKEWIKEGIPKPRTKLFTILEDIIMRKQAVTGLTDFYTTINKKFDYSQFRSSHFYYQYSCWYREPLSSELFTKNPHVKKEIDAMRGSHITPLCDINLETALQFSGITEDQPKTPIMECTGASKMAAYAILYALIPHYMTYRLKVERIDFEIAINEDGERAHQLTHSIKEPVGLFGMFAATNWNYSTQLTEIAKLLEAAKVDYPDLDIRDLNIHNILLHGQKAKRMYYIAHTNNSLLWEEQRFTSSIYDVKPGDCCAISGHPKYTLADGRYSAENVYCIGYTPDSEPLFICFMGKSEMTRIGKQIFTFAEIKEYLYNKYYELVGTLPPFTPELYDYTVFCHTSLNTEQIFIRSATKLDIYQANPEKVRTQQCLYTKEEIYGMLSTLGVE